MDQQQGAAAVGAEGAASEAAAGGQQRRENNVATGGGDVSDDGGGNVSDDGGGDDRVDGGGGGGNAAVHTAAAAPATLSIVTRAAPQALLPAPVASRWPPLSERLVRKRAAADAARASAVAALGGVTAAIVADDAAGEAAANQVLKAANASSAKASEILDNELARRERLRVVGLLDDESGDALPGGVPSSGSLAGLPFDLIREVFWRLPRDCVRNVVPLVCSDWARLPLDVRACCTYALVGVGSSAAVRPDAADLCVDLANAAGGGARMTREALSAALGASPRLEKFGAWLALDQLPMLAERLGARSASRPSLLRLRLDLVCPEGASAAVTDADMEAAGASLAASAPGLESVAVILWQPWTRADAGPAETLLLSLLKNSISGGGGGGGGRLREIRSIRSVLTSAFLDRLSESLGIRKLRFLRFDLQDVFVPRFPTARGVSRTLRELRFEVRIEASTAQQQGRVLGARRPFEAFCDVPGVSAEQALAPLAGGVTRLVLDLLGSGDALPQVLRLPGCFRALRSVRSLSFRYPRASGGDMESAAEATAAVRAAAAAGAAGGGSADIVLARALRPSSRLPEAPQPWDILSSLTELDVRFLLGNYELVLPPAGMPNLRRLDMRGMQGENLPAAAAERKRSAAEPMHCLPPPPAVVPNLRWLGIGFFSLTMDPAPRERHRPQVLNFSALVPAGSSQPYRHLRSLLLHRANLVVEGGGDNNDEEVRRLLGAFPAFYPSLRMKVHGCDISSTAKRVLDGLADVYAVIEAAATAGTRGGAGGSSSSSSASASHSPPVDRTFRGICRGCPSWDFDLHFIGNMGTVFDQEEL